MLRYSLRNLGTAAGLTALLASSAGTMPVMAAEPAADAAPSTVTVEVDRPEGLKGVSCVAIATFEVDIVGHLEATTDIAGVELLTGAPSEISTTLTGTDKTRYQALVNGLYDKFAADLTAQGFKVMPQAELAALPAFQKLQGKDAGEPQTVKSPAGTNDYYSAYGLPIILADENAVIRRPTGWGQKAVRDPYINWASLFGIGTSVDSYTQQSELSKSTNCSMLNVRLTLLGGQAKIEKAFWRTSASGVADAAMAYVPLYNRVLVVGPRGYDAMSRVSLKDQFMTPKLGDITNATTSADTAGNVALNAAALVGRFYGVRGMKYSNAKKYEVRTTEADFETAVNTSFAPVSAGLVGELVRNR